MPISSPGISSEDLDMTSRRVLVTGAAGGLGAAIARAFSAHGAQLILADRNEAGMTALAEELGDTECHVYDQANLPSAAALADRAGAVDVFINNAGILAVEALLDTSPSTVLELVQVNLTGHIVLACAIARSMIARSGGVILNISSQMGFCGAEGRGVYSATKAAVAQFSRTAAVEWAPAGVRVVCLAPGRTLSPINEGLLGDPTSLRYEAMRAPIPAGRYGTVEEMAKLAVFLSSDVAADIVGETVIADGGFILTGRDWVPGRE
jgi:NAD(P)-dependent dehydrogenase (short-subunit alcohol dehydrogenase family)